MIKPKNHTLYWVYAWDEKETEYNFDTTSRLAEAKSIAREMIRDGWDHGYILFGDQGGAFTELDAAYTF